MDLNFYSKISFIWSLSSFAYHQVNFDLQINNIDKSQGDIKHTSETKDF